MSVESQVTELKVCAKCGEDRDLSDFYAEPRNKDGRFSWCKPCVRTYKNSRLDREKFKSARFNIDFNAMWASQNGLCAVCNTPMLPKGRDLDSVAVDHDHNCCSGRKSCGGCVRGLIHRRCNLVLGYAVDNAEQLRLAATYLDHWREGLT